MNEITQFQAVACVLGSLLLICIAVVLTVLVRNGRKNKEPEAKDVPGDYFDQVSYKEVIDCERPYIEYN
jgi:hypothetical protein